MEAQDPLSQLADIHLPETVSWWPPALGWWLLAALLLGAGLLGLLWLRARWYQRRRLAAALRELEACRESLLEAHTAGAAAQAYLNAINTVLRRVALVHHPARQVAALSGSRWLAFLDEAMPDEPFSQGPGRALGEALYRPDFQGDPDAVHQLAATWIRHQYARREPWLPRWMRWPRRREARA